MKRTIRLLFLSRCSARTEAFAAALALAVAFAALALSPAAAFAQRGRPGAGGFGQGRERGPVQMDEQTVIDVAVDILHLSDAQKQQTQAIFDAAVKAAAPIVTQTQGAENALFEAVKAGKSDDEIKEMALDQGALRGEILLLQAQAFSKLWAILTAQQKSEAGILIYSGIGEFLNMAHPPAPAAIPGVAIPAVNTQPAVPPRTQ